MVIHLDATTTTACSWIRILQRIIPSCHPISPCAIIHITTASKSDTDATIPMAYSVLLKILLSNITYSNEWFEL